MMQQKISHLQDCLEKQLAAYEEIYHIAGSLNELCSQASPDGFHEGFVNMLLKNRQQLMLTVEETHNQALFAKKSLQDALTPSGIRFEEFIREHQDGAVLKSVYRRLKLTLQEAISLDTSTCENLSQQRDYMKRKLLDLQSGKKAGKAYSPSQSQTEGYFIDVKKK
jgi:flagellar biosynthesis chaperone FliJ